MFNPFDYPLLILVVLLPNLSISALIGAWFRTRRRNASEENRELFTFILGGTLTLLALIVGFTLSMAVSRYDQRKNLEAEESNAIGTEYVRANLLPSTDAAKVRALLRSYVDQRILRYTSRTEQQIQRIDAQTANLQNELWSTVSVPSITQLGPLANLVVGGMNDVLNSQAYTQAAWWNRIPIAAWILLITISIFCNLLIGYSARKSSVLLFLILPIALCISVFLIADIDSPQRGVIRVRPHNLESLAQSLRSQEVYP